MSPRFSSFATAGWLTVSASATSSCERERALRNSSSVIASRSAAAFAATRARRAGVKSLVSSLKGLCPLMGSILHLGDIRVIKLDSDRDHSLVEAIIDRFVAANSQDRRPSGIESVKYSQRSSAALHTQLTHMSVLRSVNP